MASFQDVVQYPDLAGSLGFVGVSHQSTQSVLTPLLSLNHSKKLTNTEKKCVWGGEILAIKTSSQAMRKFIKGH